MHEIPIIYKFALTNIVAGRKVNKDINLSK
jgi:hypothetical protein